MHTDNAVVVAVVGFKMKFLLVLTLIIAQVISQALIITFATTKTPALAVVIAAMMAKAEQGTMALGLAVTVEKPSNAVLSRCRKKLPPPRPPPDFWPDLTNFVGQILGQVFD